MLRLLDEPLQSNPDGSTALSIGPTAQARRSPFPLRDRVHVMKSDRATISIVLDAAVTGCHALSGYPNSALRSSICRFGHRLRLSGATSNQVRERRVT